MINVLVGADIEQSLMSRSDTASFEATRLYSLLSVESKTLQIYQRRITSRKKKNISLSFSYFLLKWLYRVLGLYTALLIFL